VIDRFISVVAGLAVCGSCRLVIECGLPPVCGIVASRTLATEMVSRFVLVMAGLAVHSVCGSMIECDLTPRIGIMAGRTITLKVIKRFYGCVAGITLVGCTSIFAIDMALFTLQDLMLSSQWEKSMFCPNTAWRKQDCHRNDSGCIGLIGILICITGFFPCGQHREEC
jgi:hypothetical protein